MIHFIDIETSGLDPVEHEIIEVGVVSAEKGVIKGGIEFSVPFDLERASPRALEVNGWGKRPFAEQVSKAAGAAKLADGIRKGDLVASWHVLLDFGFLNPFCQAHLGDTPWGHRGIIDMPSLVMGKLGVLTSGSSRDLMSQLGIDPDFEGRHTAYADALANYWAYKQLGLFEVIA
jgi:DNA polymerase III epsilon subunit-like protein